MLTDHAIVLKPENIDQIVQETPATRESMEDLIKDQAEQNEGTWYVVFYRLTNGLPTWVVLDEQELKETYNLSDIQGRFEKKFEKVL
jgi:hypothetical protein